MTRPMMDFRALVEKSGDADLLREMIGFAAERLMALGLAPGPAPTMARRTPSGWRSVTVSVIATGRPGPAVSICTSRGCARASGRNFSAILSAAASRA